MVQNFASILCDQDKIFDPDADSFLLEIDARLNGKDLSGLYDALIDGSSIVTDPNGVRKKIGFLTSELKLEEFFTPNYLFDFFSELYGVDQAERDERKRILFQKFGVDEFAEVKVANLSTGMKQKVSLIISLVHDPQIIIFDEPTNGLDPAGMKQIRDLLKTLCTEYGITIMISSHILSEIESIADTVGVINHGVMMKEISMKEIEQMSLAYIELSVLNTKKAAYVLSEKLGVDNFKIIEDEKIRIYDSHVSTQELSKTLALNDVEVISLGKKAETLEDYFLKMTGEVEKSC